MRDFNKANVPKPDYEVKLPSGYQFFDIEIGCGVGFHPIDYAKDHPDRLLVAIEKTSEKFDKFVRRVAHHENIKNVVPVHSNAVWWITHNVESGSVDRYFILYPNPYPKDAQKRFFNMPFMKYLVETLKMNGTITLATNEKFYFEESVENAEKIFGLKVFEAKAFTETKKPRTHFEKKYLERGETCYNLIVQKV